MKKAAVILALLLCSCAHEINGVCRHDALYCASIYIEQYPVRIAVGPPGHGQAQAMMNDQWQWLRRSGNLCYVSSKDEFNPDQYYSIMEFMGLIEGSYHWKR